ncbi:putative kinesin-1 motor protein [Tilletiaria anomala UBC 951]|uniref:Putative kinesin-1 motor protein n=1 Tax=Tilletiaria anomala (strain ATCC 24038 / CBS 436.72 / UBC 951) TaxID=1037660 RepID=A0A066VW57_TILAU|nr:putative kinesin-1 motor protein [Tilletiaria anomala UBC 951]KDN45937.1 putative kinesin-1 motor protein [Tilletiaria anomala UBC 951]
MSGNVKVVARFRPPNSLELREGGEIIVEFLPAETQGGEEAVKIPSATNAGADAVNGFTFDRVFPMDTKQRDVFEYGIKETVNDVINGYNGTIFAYGQTGSGKTFTMMGSDIDDEHNKGIIPRITEQIFESIMSSPANLEYLVKVSYMEIYMEKIRDLLQPQNDNLQIHEDKARGVYVKGLTDFYVGSTSDVYEIMRQGGLARAVSSTNMNAESSRSHSIFLISIQQRNTETGSIKTGNLYLVDLAGSEKVGKTGASGQTLEEAKKINKSLSALGMVINALTDGKSTHIPYRDSRLTRILQESLGGNSRTTLIINCSPCSYNLDETISTLRFGVRAKSIKNKARVNAELSPAELKALLKKIKAEADRYQSYIQALESELKMWRSGSKVPEAAWAELAKAIPCVGSASLDVPPVSLPAAAAPAVAAPVSTAQRLSANLSNGTRPQSPAVEVLTKELSSRPETPTALSIDKDEREEFLRRENELADQISEKENALKEAERGLRETTAELTLLRESQGLLESENKSMTAEMNEIKLQLERVTYEHKEASITMDILKEQNADMANELEELRKSFNETANKVGNSGSGSVAGAASKDAAAQDGKKERKKAEKMAKMMADFNAGIVSEKEEQIRDTLAKLEDYGAGGAGGELSKDDISMLREQLLESQTLVREQQGQVRQSQEEAEILIQRRDEVEARLAQLETDYEELLVKTIREEESRSGAAGLKDRLEAQYASKREAQLGEIADLKRQVELKVKEVATLQATNESLRGANDELKRAFVITAAGVEGGKNLAESAREMERVRKTMTSQLAEFDNMKKSLMRDLQNRCEKVVELEISLDESKEQYNNVVRSSNTKAQQKKMAFLERNLEQLTHVQKQLVEQNSTLKKEVAIAERKLIARNERIQALELNLSDSQTKLDIQNKKFEEQIQAVREKLNQAKESRAMPGIGGNPAFGRIAKPLRGGGPAAAAPPTISGQGPVGGVARAPTAAGSAQQDANSAKSRANWFFSSSKQL